MEPSDLPPILENAPDIVYALDAEGIFLSLNLAVEPVLGYRREELLGLSVFDYMHPDDVGPLRTSMEESVRARDTGMRLVYLRMLHKSGSVRYFEINRRLVFAEDNIVRSEGIARDITEQKLEDLHRQVVQNVREEVWEMGGDGDYDHLLLAIRDGLQALDIPFENCGINVVERSERNAVTHSRTLTRDGGWLTSDTAKAGDLINEWWRLGEVVYRPDVEEEDRYGEMAYIQRRSRIRAIVDVPFSHGTLAVSSTIAGAFGAGDIALFSDLASVLSEGFHRIGDLRSLALSEERYRTLVETPDFIVMLLDPNGVYQYVSPQVKQWIGYAPEEFYADPQKGQEIVHPEDVDKVSAAFAQAAAGKTPKSIEFRWNNSEGKECWASESLFPIADAEGQVHTVQVVLQDITEKMRVLDELQRAQVQLVQSEKMAALGNLVSGIAHEINTPVGAIHSMHNTLVRAVEKLKDVLESDFSEDVRANQELQRILKIIEESNRVIENGTKRVTTIVRSLRNFARMDEVEMREVDLHEGLEDSLMLIFHDIKNRIDIVRELGPLPRICCYPSRLNQVFLNILNNAQQAIEGRGTITIRTRLQGECVVVEVADSGAGISEGNLLRIFDPGFTTKGVGVGTGLWLSICYQIVEEHKGHIEVESQLGKGTTFRISLPVDMCKVGA